MLTSSFFLAITLLIYTIFPKLLTYYTRIMRHYTSNLMFAFIILAINQLKSFYGDAPVLCEFFGKWLICLENFRLSQFSILTFLGFAIQYFFLTSFTLMTMMSFELWMNLR